MITIPVRPETATASIAAPYQLVSTRHGAMLVNRNDIYMGQAYLHYGECCEIESQFLLSLLRPPGLVIEAGANMGVHTIPMAVLLASQNRTLLAFEPQPVIFQQLCANLALNGLMNVTALPYACGSHTGAVSFPLPDYQRPGNFGAASLCDANPTSSPATTVQCVRLDDLVSDSHVGLIKIDVEGYELEVLQGASGILHRSRPLLYVENDRMDRSTQLIQWLFDQDYRLWWHIPPLFNPDNLRADKGNRYPGVCSFNMLCVPRQSSIRIEGQMEIVDPTSHAIRS